LPVLRGWGFKHGDWILTCRKRFFSIDVASGYFNRFKDNESVPIESFPLREIHTI
jgi:hypothetical protein